MSPTPRSRTPGQRGDPARSDQIRSIASKRRSDSHPSRLREGPRDHLESLVRRNRGSAPPLRVAVVYPVESVALLGAVDVQREGVLSPVLVGPTQRMREVATRNGLEIEDMDLIEAADETTAARAGVDAVRDGRADLLMKGSLHTSTFMRAALAERGGLRRERRASHVFVFDVPGFDRPLFVTDAVVNVSPGLAEKADICQNGIDLARALGVSRPKVAILSALERVDPAVPSTLDAAALSKMADRDEITGAIVDGPLALDDAISPASLAIKHITSSLQGRADLLVVPNLESGNILYKSFIYMAGAEAAGIVVGLQVPLILTSRADSVRTRLASAALASLWAKTVANRF